MAVFVQKLWKDRKVQYPSRRKLTNVSTSEQKTVSIKRAEGAIEVEGDKFNAANFNNLENRLALAFLELENQIKDTKAMIDLYYPTGKIFMSLVNLYLDDPNRTNGVFPGTEWVRIKDRLLIPGTTAGTDFAPGTEYTTDKQQFKLEGTINTSGSLVGYHTITLNEMPSHAHTIYDEDYHSAAANTRYSGWRPGDNAESYYIATVVKNAGDTKVTGDVIESPSTGTQHKHNINLQKSFNADTKKISTLQRCIKVYAWQRTR